MQSSQNRKIHESGDFLRRALSVAAFAVALCLALGAASGCTQIIGGVELPHDKRLVINGELIAGEPVRNILIGQTLPPLDTLYYERTLVTDAEAFITVDGRQYPLKLQAPPPAPPPRNPNLPDSLQPRVVANSLYEAPGLIAEPGKTYRLSVRWRDMQAEAETFTPVMRSPRSIRIEWDSISTPIGSIRDMNGNLVVMYRRDPFVAVVGEIPIGANETQVMPTMLLHNLATRDSLMVNRHWQDNSSGLVRDSASGVMRFRFGGIALTTSWTYPPNGQPPIRTDYHFPKATTRVTVNISLYDRAFEYFQRTSGRMFPGASGPFGGGGVNPIWNVRGDGIGIFVGRTNLPPIVVEQSP